MPKIAQLACMLIGVGELYVHTVFILLSFLGKLG